MTLENRTPEQERAERLTWLGVTDLRNTFNTMKIPHGYGPAMAAFKEMAAGTAPYSLLMVYGVTGNGKSRGCEALVISMYDRGIRVKRDRWSDIVRTLKSKFNGNGRHGDNETTYEQYFSGLRKRERLIFDDVGSGSTLGAWEWGELEDIIDYRYEHRLFTIVTTNLDIKQFPERILSRFRDKSRARLILNESADFRPLVKAAKGK